MISISTASMILMVYFLEEWEEHRCQYMHTKVREQIIDVYSSTTVSNKLGLSAIGQVS